MKTPQEIALFDAERRDRDRDARGVRGGDRPGRHTSATSSRYCVEGMLGRGAEYMATNTVCSGPNTNPWRAEATDRPLEPGDLVYVDTDTVGVEGILLLRVANVLCGLAPSRPARSATYAPPTWLPDERWSGPGITCAELAARRRRSPSGSSPALRMHDPRRRPRGGEPERLPPQERAVEPRLA